MFSLKEWIEHEKTWWGTRGFHKINSYDLVTRIWRWLFFLCCMEKSEAEIWSISLGGVNLTVYVCWYLALHSYVALHWALQWTAPGISNTYHCCIKTLATIPGGQKKSYNFHIQISKLFVIAAVLVCLFVLKSYWNYWYVIYGTLGLTVEDEVVMVLRMYSE